ncbi:MaoC/PaaZ C-terminal domain-containing protein [Millisia brevis]|uniref:MaoC/PaaZ C-terminal domain-containing protein n=1 Tax=Millisia brevis TaxID=264148 RepID=UPI0008296D5C|nr:MaoC/PaaZ C-terminal domain-containing protein [Millisia brevis]
MTTTQVTTLDGSPSLLGGYLKAFVGSLPVIGTPKADVSAALPARTVELAGQRVDPTNLAEYTSVCGLRLSEYLPVTYPFILSFPVVMSLMTSRDFPIAAVGLVHATNVIEQVRPIGVEEPLDIAVHAENLREHRKGLLVDLVTDVNVGRRTVWRQTSTFLRQQRTSLSDQPRPEPAEEATPAVPTTTLRVDQKTISRYAAVSGDRNPIHITNLGAKALGFPRTIAHGMYTSAAVLSAVEGKIPDHATYAVKFGKPMLLPGKGILTATRADDAVGPGAWDIELTHPTKGYPFLTATIR